MIPTPRESCESDSERLRYGRKRSWIC